MLRRRRRCARCRSSVCGRVTLTVPDVHELARQLEAEVLPTDAPRYRPRYNAAPSDEHFIVLLGPRGTRLLVPAVWGSPGGGINARAEKARPWRRRAIVPADGFFEWTGPRDDRRPIWFRPAHGGLLQLAAFVDELPDGRLGFVILTTEARGEVAKIHDRMPLILPRQNTWLAKADVPPPDDALTATEVSKKVNDVRNDDASVLEPPEARPPPRQLGLF